MTILLKNKKNKKRKKERKSKNKNKKTKMEHVVGQIDCIIECDGIQNPFCIQPKCKLKRLKEVVGNGLSRFLR